MVSGVAVRNIWLIRKHILVINLLMMLRSRVVIYVIWPKELLIIRLVQEVERQRILETWYAWEIPMLVIFMVLM